MWSMICFRFFLLLSKTKIFFVEFGFGCVAVVVSVTSWFFGRRIDSNFSFRVFHSLLRFLFLVFAKKSARRQAMCSNFLIRLEQWSSLRSLLVWPALLCNYDPNFGKILYQKESSSGSSLCVFFRGDITSWHMFVRTCDWPSLSGS